MAPLSANKTRMATGKENSVTQGTVDKEHATSNNTKFILEDKTNEIKKTCDNLVKANASDRERYETDLTAVPQNTIEDTVTKINCQFNWKQICVDNCQKQEVMEDRLLNKNIDNLRESTTSSSEPLNTSDAKEDMKDSLKAVDSYMDSTSSIHALQEKAGSYNEIITKNIDNREKGNHVEKDKMKDIGNSSTYSEKHSEIVDNNNDSRTSDVVMDICNTEKTENACTSSNHENDKNKLEETKSESGDVHKAESIDSGIEAERGKVVEERKAVDRNKIELQRGSPVQQGITQEMVDEEEKYKKEEEKNLEEIREKARAELLRTGKKQRYDRLQLLLNRSQMYATYLLGRINARREAEEKKSIRQEKTKKEQEEKANTQRDVDHKNQGNDKKVEVKKAKKKRGRQKRKLEETINTEEYEDDEELQGKAKKLKTDPTEQTEVTGPPKQEDETKPLQRTLNGEKISDRQPLLLTGGVMREYQLEGMEWLRGLFEHGINGILADEMGLGKTIQSIALICTLVEQKVVGPFLIAAPLSTLPNWISEFKKFAPEVQTVLYHGNIKERSLLRRKLLRIKKYSHGLRSLPVVISSYEILMRDRALLEQYNVEWKYLIVDEGHRIKNLNCKLIKELKLYRTSNRLLLTGTPLQNNLSELWSLLNFLLPDIFDDLSSFQSWFDFSAIEDNQKLIAQEQEASVLQTLHSILTPFLLRRLKTDVDLSIPPKKEILVYAPLTQKQQDFYRTTLDRTILDAISKKNNPVVAQELTPSGRPKRKSTKVIKYIESAGEEEEFDLDQLIKEMEEMEKRKEEAEAIMSDKQSKLSIVNIKLQNIMMMLRKCCNHPYLLEYPYNAKTGELIIDERLIECSGKMLMLDRMLPELKRRGHKVLLFSQMTQMLDIFGDYCSLKNYKYSRIDGTMRIEARQESIEKFTDDDEVFLFLLSTRAGGLGLNLMMADTCIIYDSDWNPQVDLQAQDRCHRIGQKKAVVIYRLVTANTIDQRIIERAANKRKLEKMIIHKKNFKGHNFASAISPQELLELLESKDANSSVDIQGVISDENLNKLLDRSDMAGWELKKSTEKDSDSTKNEPNVTTPVQDTSVTNAQFKVLETKEVNDFIF
ncbi:lymphocyte-specific helicase-like isoform X2 [Hydractinia symbiolongicarpus]|nr:lymphocyte-specific helicase-like isoform X2 [Hydractinia symbiolongicarpus]